MDSAASIHGVAAPFTLKCLNTVENIALCLAHGAFCATSTSRLPAKARSFSAVAHYRHIAALPNLPAKDHITVPLFRTFRTYATGFFHHHIATLFSGIPLSPPPVNHSARAALPPWAPQPCGINLELFELTRNAPTREHTLRWSAAQVFQFQRTLYRWLPFRSFNYLGAWSPPTEKS